MAVILVDVETAITAIQEGGQSYTLEGFTYSAANLSALIELRDRLRREDSRSTGQRPMMRAVKFGSASY